MQMKIFLVNSAEFDLTDQYILCFCQIIQKNLKNVRQFIDFKKACDSIRMEFFNAHMHYET